MKKLVTVSEALTVIRKYIDKEYILEAVERIQALGADYSPPDWQDIKTAPKNGVWILAFDRTVRPTVRRMFYSPYGWLDRDMKKGKPFHPSEWFPLPADPGEFLEVKKNCTNIRRV